MNAYNPVNRVAEYTHEGKELLDEYPVMSVAIVFGLGVATGLAVVSLLAETPQKSPHWSAAHRLGEQLLESMSSVLPDKVTSAFRCH